MAMQLHKGWPYDGAINDNIPPKADEDIVAGMAVKKDSSGEAVKADGTAGEHIYFAMQDQAALDVQFANSLPVLGNNYIVYTDQFVAAAFAQDDDLEIGDTANAGKFMKHSGGGKPKVGKYDGTFTINGKSMIRIKIFGHAAA